VCNSKNKVAEKLDLLLKFLEIFVLIKKIKINTKERNLQMQAITLTQKINMTEITNKVLEYTKNYISIIKC
jgi:hypothetical protein